jgi:hypothetical protein
MYAASARFYADAFRAAPKLAGDLDRQHRHNAALAGCGQGKDQSGPDQTKRRAWRKQALDRRRAGLAAYGQKLMVLEGTAGGVWALAFSPDGRTLAVGGMGRDGKRGEINVWHGAPPGSPEDGQEAKGRDPGQTDK